MAATASGHGGTDEPHVRGEEEDGDDLREAEDPEAVGADILRFERAVPDTERLRFAPIPHRSRLRRGDRLESLVEQPLEAPLDDGSDPSCFGARSLLVGARLGASFSLCSIHSRASRHIALAAAAASAALRT